MASSINAGLDFGTSNTAIGYASPTALTLATFSHGAPSTPSALFFDEEEGLLISGREAEERFLEGQEGRYLRALKSILGTSLAQESTRLGRRSWPFKALLQHFIADVRNQAEAEAGADIRHVVAGRPVRFDDDDDAKDKEAEATLEAVLRSAGFDEVSFVYEPVAALLSVEEELEGAEYAFVADIGGGTSDFSVALRRGQTTEILANHGIHIGGTDLDRRMSLEAVMPSLGYGSTMRALASDAVLPVPPIYFTELATWQKIHFCYTQALMREVKEVRRLAFEPEKIGRLIEVMDQRLGHHLANQVEQAKIALSGRRETHIALADAEGWPQIPVGREALDLWFDPARRALQAAVGEALARAGLTADRIKHLVLTGGSTLLPVIRDGLRSCLPNAAIVPCDPFTAVASGLTRAAQRKL